jgi:hypothetical protein
MKPEGAPLSLLVFLSLGGGLAQAGLSLSAPRLAGVAAAVLKISQFEPVVARQETNLFRPGLRAPQVGEKGPGAGAGFFILSHGATL